jgi:hypothetical protein
MLDFQYTKKEPEALNYFIGLVKLQMTANSLRHYSQCDLGPCSFLALHTQLLSPLSLMTRLQQ